MTSATSSRHPGFIVRCWSGKAPLWQAFWFCGIAGTIVALIVFVQLGAALSRLSFNPFLSGLFLVAVNLGYLAFASVSIWRCAGKGKVSSLSALAKVYAILSFVVLAVAVVIGFMFQLQS